MRFQTKTTIDKAEVEALKSCVLNGIANVLWGDGRNTFMLTPEQVYELGRFKERLDMDIDWFMYEKDSGVSGE